MIFIAYDICDILDVAGCYAFLYGMVKMLLDWCYENDMGYFKVCLMAVMHVLLGLQLCNLVNAWMLGMMLCIATVLHDYGELFCYDVLVLVLSW